MLYIFAKSTIAAGGSRHRAFFVADFLRQNGHDLELVIAPVYRKDMTRTQARWDYVKKIFSLRKNDVVLIQNVIFSTYTIFCFALAKILFRPKYIFDFDDATWVQNPIAPRVLAFFSDKIIVASHALTKWPPIRNKPILIMPNLVNYDLAERYKNENLSRPKSDKVVLGWMGSGPLSMHNLQILVPVFEELVRQGVLFIFKLVGVLKGQYPQKHLELLNMFTIPGMSCEFVDTLDWKKEGEIQKVNATFDIGLCPLVDNESNRNRCSLKILDYMAASLPVVVSPVGENVYFVDADVSGYLPANAEEWVKVIKKLISDPSLRQNMGRASFEKLKKDFSYQNRIKEYETFLGLK
jgi:glycosyltransferase involved in cell wall biosynthesis